MRGKVGPGESTETQWSATGGMFAVTEHASGAVSVVGALPLAWQVRAKGRTPLFPHTAQDGS